MARWARAGADFMAGEYSNREAVGTSGVAKRPAGERPASKPCQSGASRAHAAACCYAPAVMRARLVVIANVVVLASLACGSLAHAGKFGGFSADGTRWLDGKSSVCSAAAVDGSAQVVAPPSCEAAADARALAAYKFVGPPRIKVARSTASGAVDLSLGADGRTITVYGDAGGGKRPMAVFDAGQDVAKVSGPWLSSDGALLAVEYTLVGGAKTAVSSIVFDVRAPMASMAPRAGGVVERVLKRSTTWIQKQIVCEQAGVTLNLGKDRRFNISIESKCQGSHDRLRVAGRYVGEEPDKLLLTFQNEDGPEEHLECRVEACEDVVDGPDCIRCQSDDVGFVVKPKPTK